MKGVVSKKEEKIVDTLETDKFPHEGKIYPNSICDVTHPLKDSFFKLGLETNHCQMQDFLTSRRKQNPNYLFTDPTFPPCLKVLVKNYTMHDITWKRPHEMSANPELFFQGAHKNEVIQGGVGSCYFLGPSSAVSAHPKLIKNIIPPGQTVNLKDSHYNGLLKFRFWRFGKWVEVIVDDLLPTINGTIPAYARTSNPNEFWLSLLEKAYAKLHGSYEAMNGGFTANSFVDLTGGVVFQHKLNELDSALQNHDMFERILKAVRHKSFVCCGIEENFTPVTHEGEREVTGLKIAQTYAITGACRVRLKNGSIEELVRVRNPWETSKEWKDLWGARLNLWKFLSMKTMMKLRRRTNNDEEWWMTYRDLSSHFHHLTICTLGPETYPDGKSSRGKWVRTVVRGIWKKGYNAGGNINDIESYKTNPQYRIQIDGPDALTSSTVMSSPSNRQCAFHVGLMQEHRKYNEQDDLPLLGIGLRIYKIRRRVVEKLPVNFLQAAFNVVLQTPSHQRKREISLFGRLYPGHYVIIPSTFYSGKETSYLMRIFTEKAIQLQELS